MNTTVINDNLMCNRNQMSKNLPLKKRRVYMIDPPTIDDQQAECCPPRSKQSCLHNESNQTYTAASSIVPTPPSSPHLELLRQQYAYLLGNTTSSVKQNYFPGPTYDAFVTQQYVENYRASIDRRQQYGYAKLADHQNRTDSTVDEHFKKSLENYVKLADRCLTPDEPSSHSSIIEQAAVDSIEEHFARSLAKFRQVNKSSSNDDRTSKSKYQKTESVVDDHFAKALGSSTWERLKERL